MAARKWVFLAAACLLMAACSTRSAVEFHDDRVELSHFGFGYGSTKTVLARLAGEHWEGWSYARVGGRETSKRVRLGLEASRALSAILSKEDFYEDLPEPAEEPTCIDDVQTDLVVRFDEDTANWSLSCGPAPPAAEEAAGLIRQAGGF